MNTSLLFHEIKTACAFSSKFVKIPNKMIAINNKMDGRIINHEMILEISISYRILDDFDNLRMRMDPHILFIASFCIEFCFLIA